MSVIIKGMKMPESCLACPMREQGTIHEWELYCGLTGDYIGHWDDKSLNNGHRPDVCPLVEVPTPHGHLIDGNVLWETLRYGYDVDLSELPETLAALLGMIDHQDTIIEAEEGEEDDEHTD